MPASVMRTASPGPVWALRSARSRNSRAPRLPPHPLRGLMAAPATEAPPAAPLTWSTFYAIRRYGGLQIFLRALHAGSLVLSDPGEEVGDFLTRAGRAGIT